MTRVLLVEDDTSFAEAVTEYLRDGGHEVLQASTAEEALDLMKEFHFDIIVADYDLGEARPHGLTVLEKAASDTKTVLWSGCDRTKEIERYGFRPHAALLKSDIGTLEVMLK